MKLMKSLILGSAAALVGMTAAQAADLPLAEPVEYVKVCDTYGAGFFYIPGSETCLLIGGYVRADYSLAEVTNDEEGNNFGLRARARVWFDARTATEYGTLRSYIRLQFQRDSGGVGGSASTSSSSDDSFFDKAFVQFGGLTAGLTDSFWDFKPYPTFTNPFISDRTLAVLAYTADFGDGFSASIAIEDSTARRFQGGDARYAGQEFPDLVGNVRVEQSWGQAQLSGALREVNPVKASIANPVGGDNELGWGVQAGVKINLPFLAKGDYLWASGAYSEGNLSLLGLDDVGFGNSIQNIVSFNPRRDFSFVNGDTELTTGYAFNLGVLHYWTPQWRSALQGTYIDIDDPRQGADWDAFGVTTNLIWTPVKKLDIGVEVSYVKTDYADEFYRSNTSDDDDAFIGRLRIQRDF